MLYVYLYEYVHVYMNISLASSTPVSLVFSSLAQFQYNLVQSKQNPEYNLLLTSCSECLLFMSMSALTLVLMHYFMTYFHFKEQPQHLPV